MNDLYDAIIVGGGPAGLAAAIYLARAKFSVLLIEKEQIGGQITITDSIYNYPGVIQSSGKELTKQMEQQALNFKAEILMAEVTKLELTSHIKTITTTKGIFQAVGLILATGCRPRILGFPGEQEFRGRGVAYCATCDGEFFTGKDIFVIGGGFAAAQEAVFLTKYGKKVIMIIRESDFTCARQVADKAKNHPKMEIHYNTEITRVSGNGKLQLATFINNQTKETWSYQTNGDDSFGVFVFAGYKPVTDLFKNQLALNETGNLIVDSNQKTNVAGVYGAGDVCVKELRQVVTAVSDGATAATALEKYIPDTVSKYHLKTKAIANDSAINDNHDLIDANLQDKLQSIFSKLKQKLVFKCIDDGSSLSKQIQEFINQIINLSDFLTSTTITGKQAGIAFYNEFDEYLNISFYGLPTGHEFNSFIMAIINCGGLKQPIENDLLQQINAIKQPYNIKIMVSLNCTMCPDVVMNCQRIAIENKKVEACMYDLAHYPSLKDKYQIMSVPCMIINDRDIYFGKKDLKQILALLQ